MVQQMEKQRKELGDSKVIKILDNVCYCKYKIKDPSKKIHVE